GPLDWLAPFPLFTGLGLVVAYMLLGSTWLLIKTEGPLHDEMRRRTQVWVWALLAVIAVLSLWTALAHPAIAERWFSLPNLYFFLPVPLLVVFVAGLLLRALQRRRHLAPVLVPVALVVRGSRGAGAR